MVTETAEIWHAFLNANVCKMFCVAYLNTNDQTSVAFLASNSFARIINICSKLYTVSLIFNYVFVCSVQHVMNTNATVNTRERNVLFNDALNTFYLRLYGVRHMVKDHSDSEKGNPLPPHRLLLSINSKGSFICTIPQTG